MYVQHSSTYEGVSTLYFSYFSTKTYVVGTHYKCLSLGVSYGTHNIDVCREIRKHQYFSVENGVLSGASTGQAQSDLSIQFQ